jgi:hypothetical protein
MDVTDPIRVAFIALVSAMLGAVVTAAFTSWRERRAFRWAMNRDNYVLFMDAVARKATYPVGSVERMEASRVHVEATARILLQGSPDVVTALDEFQNRGVLKSEEDFLVFARLVAAMRKDVGGKSVPDFVSLARSALFEQRQ